MQHTAQREREKQAAAYPIEPLLSATALSHNPSVGPEPIVMRHNSERVFQVAHILFMID